MTRGAIHTPAISAFVEEGRDHVRGIRDSEALGVAYEKKLFETRQDAEARRIKAGMFLLRVRKALPARGTKADGWKAFLEAIELDDSTAHRWMDLADPQRLTMRSNDAGGGSEGPADVPPPTDADAPVEQAGDPEPVIVIDRDTWCTPKPWADALGDWDLDPCSNERSHIQAAREFRLDRGEDGLFMASKVDAKHRVFLNPPYSDVRPWIDAYAHTRFCFLLKFDPSTKWFAELVRHASAVFVPAGTRIEFEPPEGVPPEKAIANQFPHALFYARESDATKAIRELCFQPWRIK